MIRVVQLLCPQRHCIIGLAYETDGEAVPAYAHVLQGVFDKMVADGDWNPQCGICGDRNLRTEDAQTKYKTMEEAKPDLERLADEQTAARQWFQASKG